MIVLNPTKTTLSIAGFPEFLPGEEREYGEADALHLTNRSGLVLKEESKLKKKSPNEE